MNTLAPVFIHDVSPTEMATVAPTAGITKSALVVVTALAPVDPGVLTVCAEDEQQGTQGAVALIKN